MDKREVGELGGGEGVDVVGEGEVAVEAAGEQLAPPRDVADAGDLEAGLRATSQIDSAASGDCSSLLRAPVRSCSRPVEITA
ncbi:hypothetical protein [Nannocystis sp.]|uniref:hypothetical protein n=1 Tax=Nannocystis sp. TaxID=1962667 RepID=UPI0025DEC97D|nr:hypothetical protein [Nannocystis sp.]